MGIKILDVLGFLKVIYMTKHQDTDGKISLRRSWIFFYFPIITQDLKKQMSLGSNEDNKIMLEQNN